jgi:hypothetical protein
MQCIDPIACPLLEPNAIGIIKMRSGRRLAMLGYTLDLDNQCASIAEKNVLRCIYGGFLIEEREGTISILFREIVVFE